MGGSYNTGMGRGLNKKLILVATLVVVIAVATVVAVVMTLSGNKGSGADTAVAIRENVANVNVDITGFNPATLKVKQGQQVTWTGNDPRPHRITADQQTLPGFDSTEELAQGDSYTYIFETKGTFKYYDPADPKGYTGTVVVE